MTPNEAKVLIVQILLLPLYARVCLGTVAYELVMAIHGAGKYLKTSLEAVKHRWKVSSRNWYATARI
jgi:hypothetical protein